MSHTFLARGGGEEHERTRRALARAGSIGLSIPVHDSGGALRPGPVARNGQERMYRHLKRILRKVLRTMATISRTNSNEIQENRRESFVDCTTSEFDSHLVSTGWTREQVGTSTVYSRPAPPEIDEQLKQQCAYLDKKKSQAPNKK